MGTEKIKECLKTFLSGSAKKIISGFLFWGWLVYILYSSVTPQNSTIADSGNSMFFIRMDYITHFAAYFLLFILFALWRSPTLYKIKGKTLWSGIIAGILLGILTEILQIHISGRAFNEFDILANTTGIFAGLLLTRIKLLNLF